MNNTKWIEIFKKFYYDIECSEDENIRSIQIRWETRSLDGYLYRDSTWTHFCLGDDLKHIDWLKIYLTPQNKKIVLDVLRNIHVPGEVFKDCVYVYGYRKDVDYIK